jgi:hypothetical protein
MKDVHKALWFRNKNIVKIIQMVYVNGKPDKAVVQYGMRPPVVVPAADLSLTKN